MDRSRLKIRDKEYTLGEVTLTLQIVNQGEEYLQFDLFADCHDMKDPGFAINCMSIEGPTSTKEIQGIKFELGEEIDDPLNELGESVIVEPGQVLELESLMLVFGEIKDGYIAIQMTATCTDMEEEGIKVKGELMAKVKEN